MASGPIPLRQIDGEKWKQWQILFWGAPKSLQMGTAVMKLKDTPWKKNYKKVKKRKPRQHIKKQRYHFAKKDLQSQMYGFYSCPVDVRAGP